LKKRTKSLRGIGLIANFEKASSRAVVARASALIERAGREVMADEQTVRMAGLRCKVFPTPAALAAEADLLLVFGGDGTMLQVVRDIDGLPTPILGINVGRLGFLTAISSDDLPSALNKIWKNDFVVETRPLIEATGRCHGKGIQTSAFNDIVISHGAVSRVIELDVHVDGKPITRYRGDGLIVCSPTGSTAYCLSAGGPIISPDAAVFAITPICPHSISNRTVIVSSNSIVSVKLISRELETIMAADGQICATMGADDTIAIRRSRRTARLLHLGDSSFFAAVRQKLHWSGSSV
jgi:NAD+ kinase